MSRSFDDHAHDCDRCCAELMKSTLKDGIPRMDNLCRVGRRLMRAEQRQAVIEAERKSNG